MFANIVELRKIGEDGISELDKLITNLEKQIEETEWGDKVTTRRQKIGYIDQLYKEREELRVFLKVLRRIRSW